MCYGQALVLGISHISTYVCMLNNGSADACELNTMDEIKSLIFRIMKICYSILLI